MTIDTVSNFRRMSAADIATYKEECLQDVYQAVAEAFKCQMTSLNIGSNGFEPQLIENFKAIKAVQEHSPSHHLKKLDTSFNSISIEDLKTLVSLWPALEDLNINYCKLNSAHIQFLVEQRYWSNLTALDLSYNKIYDAELNAIVQAQAWPQLKELKLQTIKCTDQGMATVINAKHWPHLHTLAITRIMNKASDRIPHAGIQALVKASHLSTLTALNLACTLEECGSEGINGRHLAQATHLSALKTLNLSANNLRHCIAALAKAPQWGQLTALDLSWTSLNNEEMKHVTQATHWSCLTNLQMNTLHFNKGSCGLIAQAVHWRTLTTLGIAENEGALAAFCQATYLTALTDLDLSSNHLKGTKISALQKPLTTHWTALKVLNLKYNDLGKEGLNVLAAMTFPSTLRVLHLNSNALDDTDVPTLFTALSTHWPSLTQLTLTGNKISETLCEDIEAFIERDKKELKLAD